MYGTKLTPNSITRPEGVEQKLEPLGGGLYVLKNAYVGHYEFFKGKPLSGSNVPKRDERRSEK